MNKSWNTQCLAAGLITILGFMGCASLAFEDQKRGVNECIVLDERSEVCEGSLNKNESPLDCLDPGFRI